MRLSLYFLIITFVFALKTALAQNIHVTLFDGTTLDCSASTTLPAACKMPNGTEVFVDANERFAFSITLDADNNLKFLTQIKEVKVDEQLLYASATSPFLPSAGLGGYGEVNNFTPPRPTHYSLYLENMSTFSNLDNFSHIDLEPAALTLLHKMKEIARSKRDQALFKMQSKQLEVEFSNQERAHCQSLRPREENGECPILSCAPPKQGYFFDSRQNTGLFFAFSSHQLTSISSPKAVWHPQDHDIPILENINAFGHSLEEAPYDIESSFANPGFRMNLQFMLKSCHEEDIAPLTSTINSIRKKIADKNLIQLVEVSGNFLTSQLIEPSALPENSCRVGDTWYSEELSYERASQFTQNLSPKTIDKETAQRLFDEALAMTDIAWNYIADGCYARAHLMARRFEAQGIHVDKVWIKGDLHVPEKGISWNFHVAPIVYVEDQNGQLTRMVIDPSLADRPISVDEWSNLMHKEVLGPTIETSFPFPENAANFERTAIAFSNSTPYLPNDVNDLSEVQKQEEALQTMQRYREFGP